MMHVIFVALWMGHDVVDPVAEGLDRASRPVVLEVV
jgi:hypothetical protein